MHVRFLFAVLSGIVEAGFDSRHLPAQTEVRAFVDEVGNLHIGGQVFKKRLESAEWRSPRTLLDLEEVAEQGEASVSQPEQKVPLLRCNFKSTVVLQYGGSEKKLELPRNLHVQESMILSCSEAFDRDDLSGHVALVCESTGSVSVQYHCGCVAAPFFATGFKPLWPLPHKHCFSSSDEPWTIRSLMLPDELFVNSSVPEGEAKDFPCAHLHPGVSGNFSLECVDGRLCIMNYGCTGDRAFSNALARKTTGGTASEEFASAAVRRLSPCSSVIQDAWWPTICASVTGVPYSTVAGANLPGSAINQFESNAGIFVSPTTGDLFVADWGNHRIQRWNSAGTAITVAGKTGQTGNALSTDTLQNPRDLVVAGRASSEAFGCGELFIADEGNHRILRWPPSSAYGFVVAGGGAASGSATSQLNKPTSLSVTANLDIYIADQLNHRVVVWSKKPAELMWRYNKTVAGSFAAISGATVSLLDHPTGVSLDGAEDVFVADTRNNRIMKWVQGATSGVVIGTCSSPVSIFVNKDSSVFVACQTAHCIKRWDFLNGQYLPGLDTGDCGFFGTGLDQTHPAYSTSVSRFYAPQGVFVDDFGNIFVSDTSNARVIKRGRSALTQWIISNAATTTYVWTVVQLDFFTDIACTVAPPVKAGIASDNQWIPQWTPTCASTGEGRCASNEGWIGKFFNVQTAVRCANLRVNYIDPTGGIFMATVRYWRGNDYRSVYSFGGIISGQTIRLRFPHFHTPATQPVCVKGQRLCVFTNLTADWQAPGDRIMVKTGTCAAGVALGGVPNGGMTDPATNNGTDFTLGSLTVPEVISADASDANKYLMCWCDRRGSLCQVSNHYTLFVSYLRVEGPFETLGTGAQASPQSKHGWRGSVLNVNAVQGVGLKPGDRMLVVNGQCGLAATEVFGIPRQQGAIIAYSLGSTNGVDYSWGTDFVTAFPGKYQLCWCRPRTGAPCSTIVDFQAKAGDLTVNGPSPNAQFLCIKGEVCNLTLSGVGFEPDDHVIVLDRCGQQPAVAGFPSFSGPTTQSGTQVVYSWGNQPITTTAGTYVVCWCSKYLNCLTASDFKAEVGTITIDGPFTMVDLCAVGADCTVDNVKGVGLDRFSRAAIIPHSSTCGAPSASPPPGFPGEIEGISYQSTQQGTSFYWGFFDQNYVFPNVYAMCWCHGSYNCSEIINFRVRFGDLTVRGPTMWPDPKICGSGKDCSVQVVGHSLSVEDTMIILTGACSTNTIAGGITFANAKSKTGTGFDHVWYKNNLPGGGNYVVCWCTRFCNSVSDFRMNIGRLVISAPAETHRLYCTSGAICQLTLTGFGLQHTDKLGITSSATCGSNTFVKGIPNSGISMVTTNVAADKEAADFVFGSLTAGVTAIGGNYTMCWCPSRCNLLQDFTFYTGRLLIAAPSLLHHYICWNGLPCNISGVVGLGLKNRDKVRVASTCRIETLVGGVPNSGISLNATFNGTRFSWGVGVITAVVGNYRLCWCSVHHNCTHMLDYATDVGTLVIGGPNAGQTETCESGWPCYLANITGFALRLNDRVVLLTTCGTGLPVYGHVPGNPWYSYPPFLAEVDCSSPPQALDMTCVHYRANNSFTWRLTVDPGQYRMCWCSTTFFGCDEADDYGTDIGLFTAVGPLPTQTFLCAPGFSCVVNNIVGVSLAAGDAYVVQNSSICRSSVPVPGIPDNGRSLPSGGTGGSTFTWNGNFSKTLVPHLYSLCWCPNIAQCVGYSDFITRAGFLSVIGPYANHNFRCEVGNQCIIQGVQGHALANNDRIVVVVGNCGNGTLPPDFPQNGLSDPATEVGTKYSYATMFKTQSGRYRLCWCGASRSGLGFTCLTNGTTGNAIMSSFVLDFGELFIPEMPKSGQVRDCTSGLHCFVDGFVGSIGNPLQDGAQIQVKKYAGSLQDPTCFQATTELFFPGAGNSNGATMQGTRFAWGSATDAIWAQGGNYMMCWKPPNATAYGYLAGSMIVAGPVSTSLQTFTCTKRADCVLSAVRGEKLMDGDWYKVMHSCAKDSIKAQAAALTVIGVQIVQMQAGVVKWQPAQFQGNPGWYRLCWCSKSRVPTCVDPVDFKTDAGAITIYGPDPGQNRKCDRGKDCTLHNFTGINLQANDEAQILVECETGPMVAGFSPRTAAAVSTPGGFQYTWLYVTSSPGIFRICWCQYSECGVAASSPMAAYDVEVGIITIQGPDDVDLTVPPPGGTAPLHNRTWDLVLAGVNLQVMPAGRLKIMVKCPTNVSSGTAVHSLFTGVGEPKGNTGSIYFFDSISMGNITPANEVSTGIWVDYQYALCWCRGPTAIDPSDHCNSEDRFNLVIAPVVVNCAQGYEPNRIGCNPCAIGWYKDVNGNDICQQCPTHLTTASVATIYQYRCYCVPGRYYSGGGCLVCPDSSYCYGNFVANTPSNKVIVPSDHQQPVACPANSGTWKPSTCPDCRGNYPAQSELDCNCIRGYEQSPTTCKPCPLNSYKANKGNASTCKVCDSDFAGSSTNTIGAWDCICQAGTYMVTDPLTNAKLYCSNCPRGFYCQNSEKTICPPTTSTDPSKGAATSVTDCECAAGAYLDAGQCKSCVPGGIFYKAFIGNQACSQQCPPNSKIPPTVTFAKGPENCKCDPGYIQYVDPVTFDFSCVLDTSGSTALPQTQTNVTALYGQWTLEYVLPDIDALKNDQVELWFASQLGLANSSRVNIRILSTSPMPANITNVSNVSATVATVVAAGGRRLQGVQAGNSSNGTNCSNASQANASQCQNNTSISSALLPAKVFLEVTVWQSTVTSTKQVQANFPSVDMSLLVDTLRRTNIARYALLKNNGATINHTATTLGFLTQTCPQYSALIRGQTFVSLTDSCKCTMGYYPSIITTSTASTVTVPTGQTQYWDMFPSGFPDSNNPYNSIPISTPLPRCIPCLPGRFKHEVKDEACLKCPSKTGGISTILAFPQTFPVAGANNSDYCACSDGYYRSGTQCIDCETGFYCPTGLDRTPCPANENSIKTKLSQVGECLCDKGYFRSLNAKDNKSCIPCDETYYKPTIDDGVGRCTLRCTNEFGQKSTSKVGATKQSDCVCTPAAYMKDDPSNAPTFLKCTECPSDGVVCQGGKINVTTSNGTQQIHAPPTAKNGWYMLNLGIALVEECKTQNDNGSVCLGGNNCASGHGGLLCGNCLRGYTRDKFPKPCVPCADLPGNFVLVLTLMLDFTGQAALNEFLAVSALQKTETQKNVLTVLLRMFVHWSTQIGVLSSNYNLSKLKPLKTVTTDDTSTTASVSITVNGSTTLTTTRRELWPQWFTKASGRMMVVHDLMQGVGSQQQVLECLVDRNMPSADAEQTAKMKLLIPAIWWLFYPMTLVFWTILFASFQGFVLVPLIQHLKRSGEVRKKKAREKAREERRQAKEAAAKAKIAAKEAAAKRAAAKAKRHANNLKKPGHELVVQEPESSESSSSSDSSDDDDDAAAHGTEASEIPLFYKPKWLALADEMVPSVATPVRFSYEYVAKESGTAEQQEEEEKSEQQKTDYFLQLFPLPPVFNMKLFIHAILPWIIITFNNSWNLVTTRMLQLLHCEKFPWTGTINVPAGTTVKPKNFMLAHLDTECMTFSDIHGILALISFFGLLLWSVGIVLVLYSIISGHDRQKTFVTRNFGYLLEGYEPKFWYWELLVKKADLLTTAAITYTSIAGDPRAKILLYSVQAAIFYALQLYLSPYDNRQLKLLDRTENAGLLVRQALFTGIAFCLLFDTSTGPTLAISITLISLMGYFVLGILIHIIDDYVTTQVAITGERRVQYKLEQKRAVIHKKRKAELERALAEYAGRKVPVKVRKEKEEQVKEIVGWHVEESEIKPNHVLERKYMLMRWVQQNIFVGGASDTGYRHDQLLRCNWCGPGADVDFYMPELYDGVKGEKKEVATWSKTFRLKICRLFYGISDESQLEALSSTIGGFVDLLLSQAQFKQMPARLTDMIFFLSRAVKQLKRNIEMHPNAARPPRKVHKGKEGEHHHHHHSARHEEFTSTESLKIALLQELFEELVLEISEKRSLLDSVRTGQLQVVLKREKVPLAAAWDVLEKLTNDQLRQAAKHPAEMYTRVVFNITLSQASERSLETITKAIMDFEKEKKERKRINNFLKFHLRDILDADPEMDWHVVHQMLNTLPVVELNRMTKKPEMFVEFAKEQKALTAAMAAKHGPKVAAENMRNVLTVEDLNSMLMFLQGLPVEDLHLIIEYTQVLLDFLSLPAHAKWRDDVIRRGKREESEPSFYKDMFRLRQHLQETENEEEDVPDEYENIMAVEDAIEDDEQVDLHKVLGDAAHAAAALGVDAHKSPEAQLKQILGEAVADDDGSGKSESLKSFDTLDSGIPMEPESEDDLQRQTSSSSSMVAGREPLWKKIANLRQKVGIMDTQEVAVQLGRGVNALPEQHHHTTGMASRASSSHAINARASSSHAGIASRASSFHQHGEVETTVDIDGLEADLQRLQQQLDRVPTNSGAHQG